MKAIIAGCGAVGSTLAGLLVREGNEVVIIDGDRSKLERIEERLDVAVVAGACTGLRELRVAGAQECSLFVAVTDDDEVNIVAAAAAKKLGASRCVARCKSKKYGSPSMPEYARMMGIDLIINPEELAANEVITLLRTPGSFVVESFARGAVQLREIEIEPGSRVAGRQIKDLAMQQTGLIAAISRDGRIIIPTGGTEILAGDRLFIVGRTENLKHLGKIFGKVRIPGRNIIILGGGKVGLAVARLLEQAGMSLKLIEKDRERAEFISEKLRKTVILVGDGTDADLLREKDIGGADAFVALSNDDENNIVSGLLAKELGAPMSIVMVERPEYVNIVERLGIDLAVSPRQLTVNEILRFSRRGIFISVAVLEREKAEMIEVSVENHSQAAGKKLMEAGFPKGTVVGSIVRDKEVIVPTGPDRIMAGDTLILFTVPENIPRLETLFT